ncbi:hypothetical protein AIOL_002207 [Candidatus Rhodobacter oscarellae]|uniref:Uncharacterized protein n=1 Tax=Candidatus Rhodobacter oscarellae TaxID=1675527 RepID=A0A0J9E303_9RHOB|nr:hypothetical protein AIOL_002207 [Candidatus Rhodobacter lobularis]
MMVVLAAEAKTLIHSSGDEKALPYLVKEFARVEKLFGYQPGSWGVE